MGLRRTRDGDELSVRKLAALALVALAASGCGGGGEPKAATNVETRAATPDTPAGFVVRSVKGEGFSIAVPKKWRSIDAAAAVKSSGVKRFRKENPEVGGALRILSQPSSPMKFLAIDPSKPTRATNLNVLVLAIPPAVTYEQWTQAQFRDISNVHPVNVHREDVTLPVGRAFHLSYEARFRAKGKPLVALINQYMVKRAGSLYVLTYTTRPGLAQTYRQVFEDSARSFRITGS